MIFTFSRFVVKYIRYILGRELYICPRGGTGIPACRQAGAQAGVAKLADATALEAVGSNPVGVQISPPAQLIPMDFFLLVMAEVLYILNQSVVFYPALHLWIYF